MIPDYPPPSFQEAILTPPFVPPAADAAQSQSFDAGSGGLPSNQEESNPTSFPTATSSRTITPPSASPPPLTVHTDITVAVSTVSPQGLTNTSSASDQSSSDSSIEIVNLETDSWDQERRLGVPLPRRVEREFRRLQVAESTTALVPHPPRPFERREDLLHDRCSRCGSPKVEECGNAALPDNLISTLPESSSPPSSPKGRKWKRLFIPTGMHNVENPPLSPAPSSPRSPKFGFLSAALTSNLTLPIHGPPCPTKPFANQSSPHRKESSVVRRLFGPKGKEKESPAAEDMSQSKGNLEEWEVVDPAIPESDEESSPGCGSGLSAASAESEQWHSERQALVGRDGTVAACRPVATHYSARADTAPAFINRPVKHSPQNLAPFPLFGSNSSAVSLPLAGPAVFENSRPANPSLSAVDLLQEARQPESRFASRRKAVSTLRSSPSVVWLPILRPSVTTENQNTCTWDSVPPPQASPNPLQRTVQDLHLFAVQGTHNHSGENTCVAPFETAISTSALSVIPPIQVVPSLSATDNPVQEYTHMPCILRTGTPTLHSPASALTLLSTPETPSTPSTPVHHYHGRPLPHPPGAQVSPEKLVVTPVVASAALPQPSPQAVDNSPVSALDVALARGPDDDQSDRRHYEV